MKVRYHYLKIWLRIGEELECGPGETDEVPCGSDEFSAMVALIVVVELIEEAFFLTDLKTRSTATSKWKWPLGGLQVSGSPNTSRLQDNPLVSASSNGGGANGPMESCRWEIENSAAVSCP